ncbi:MAG: hypothetical protein KA521_00925 [Crocinitomicaceae bacterium]|nr:hypothetical protein [Crocinitomicaceae bacterium]
MNFLFKGTITNHFTVKPEAKAEVAIVQNGKKIATVQTDNAGLYTLRGGVSITSNFYVVFSKTGMVEKRIEFDFTKLNEEDVPAGSEYQPVKDLSSSLINEDPKYNVSFLKTEPVGKLTWNDKKMAVEVNEGVRENMRKKIETALKDAGPKQTDAAKYQSLIVAAQSFEKEQKYQQAITKYEEALSLRPTEKLPSDKIVELSALLAKSQKESAILDQGNQQYMNLIVAAKALSDQKKYQLAIDKYNEALDIKDDQGVLDQIKTLKGLLTDAENEQKYKDALASADMFYNQKSYKTAKDKYTIASKLKPNEQHPKTRLADIEKKLADLLGAQEKKKLFDDLVNEGDALFKEEKWAEAKTKYVESLKIESGATYSAEQVKDCDVKLKEISDAQEKIANIQKWLKEGDDFFKLNKWVDSKQKFTQVIGLDPENAIAKAKLIEISAKIEEETKNAALNAQISKLIADGDALAKLQKLQEAKDKYSEALKLKSDPLVQQKIDAIDKQLKDFADKKAKEAEFLALKTEGLKLATEQKWEEAKVKLTAAKEIKADPAIDVKLTEIETKLKGLANLAKLEADYLALLSEAESKETANDVDGAIAKYKEALSKKPTGKEALDKIKELEAKKAALATAAQNEALFAKLVGEGDVAFDAKKNNDAKAKYEQALKLKNDPALVSKLETVNVALQAEKAKEVEFLALKTEGLILATEQKWEDAKTKLIAAKTIKSDPAIDTKLAEIETKLKALEGQAKLDSEYKTLLSEAESKETANDVDGAIAKYKEALSKKPTGKEALDKIKELEAKKAALATAAQNEALFVKLVGEGDVAFDAKKNNDAKAKYEQALKLKNDPALVSKLETVNVALQAEKAKEVEFLALKTEGLILATEQKWEDAKTKLIAAKTIKSDPAIDTKLAEIETKLKALEGQAKLDSEYKTLLSEAESKETANDVDGAIAKYKEALSKKPTGKEALDKIKELEGKKNAASIAISEKYTALIKSGDALIQQKKYLEAIDEYKNALKIKENSKEAIDKIAEAQRLEQLNSSTQAKNLLEKTIVAAQGHVDKEEYKKAKEILTRPFINPEEDIRVKQLLLLIEDRIKQVEAYTQKMNEAEKKVIDQDYKTAISLFEEAKVIKSNEKMPQKRIDELKLSLNKESQVAEKNKMYLSFVAKGDEQKNVKNYKEAINSYNEALKLKNNEQTILNKIKEIQQILDNEVAAKQQAVIAQQAAKVQLEKADKLFQSQKFEAAKEAYLVVQQKDPSNDYVNKQIQLIEENIAILKQKNAQQEFTKLLKEANELFDSKSYIEAKSKFEKLLQIQPNNSVVKGKLKEIDEILNPPLAAGELKPLGEVFDGSILDGFAALQKAEEQRRYRSTSSIMDGVYAASKVKNEQASIKDSEHYVTSKTIEKLNQDKNQYNSELTSEIDARLSLLQKVETEQNLDNTEALVYISNDQIKLREKINLLQVESQELSLEQMISKEETLYSLKATINQEALKISESAKSDANENIDDDKTIQGFIVENDLYKTDQVSSKRKVDNTMRVIQNSTTDFLNVKDEQLKKETDERYQTLQSNQKEIDAEKSQGQTLKNEAAYDATQLVSKNREEQQKKQVIKEGRISDFYKEIKDQQNSLSDERNAKSQEKLDATAVVNGQIVDQFTKQKQDEAVKATKQAFNTEKLKELSNNELAAASDKNLKSNDKHIANQQTINQAEQAKTVKIISPNKLGETYEEGVTEESFVQKDEKGLMKAFITRRVVVIAGRGVVYVRTQTVHATTFTKDNVSITDSTWQKETQDPKLTKHKKN